MLDDAIEGGEEVGKILEDSGKPGKAAGEGVSGGGSVEMTPQPGVDSTVPVQVQEEIPPIPANATVAEAEQAANSTSFGAKIWQIVNTPGFVVGTVAVSTTFNIVSGAINTANQAAAATAAQAGKPQCFSVYVQQVQAELTANNIPWTPLATVVAQGAAVNPNVNMTC
jgi:hypothetical protein